MILAGPIPYGLVLFGLALSACQPPPDAVSSDPSRWAESGPISISDPIAKVALAGEPYTIVALPDTQFYASTYPQIFDAQTRWIVGERAPQNLALVVHEGDLVDSDDVGQWTAAAHSMQMLDGLVPYLVSTGNHDYGLGGDGWTVTRSTLIDSYFPVSKFAQFPWFRGTFEAEHIENNYALVDVPGTTDHWLVVSLEFGPRDAVLAWADSVVKRYPSTPAMIVTHAYLYGDSSRYDHLARPTQKWNPHDYPIGSTTGAVNDGEEIWQKLILGNSNIEFVLCGHVLGGGTGRLTSIRPDGTIVNQILANYQMLPLGGGGFLRILEFAPATRSVHVRTYSPYLDEFKKDSENDFVLGY